MRNLDARLSRLEGASAAGRAVLIWEPDGEYDVGELRQRHRVGPNDRMILLGWERAPTE